METFVFVKAIIAAVQPKLKFFLFSSEIVLYFSCNLFQNKAINRKRQSQQAQ